MRFANCVFKKNLVEMEGNLFLFYGYDTPQNNLKNSQKKKKKKKTLKNKIMIKIT